MNASSASPTPSTGPDSATAAAAAPEAPVDKREQALARLQASRQSLEALWLPKPADNSRPPRGRLRVSAWLRRWRRELGEHPVVGLALQAVDEWWQRNPWRAAGEAMTGEVRQTVLPLVRRYPVAAVGLAAAAGVALAVVKPWRWPLVARQLRPLPGHASRWLLARISQAPWQSIIAGLMLARGVGAAADKAAGTTAKPARSDEGNNASHSSAQAAASGPGGPPSEPASSAPPPGAPRSSGGETLH